MKGFKAVLSLVALLLFSTYAWAEWYPGIIHVHSTFSDGRRNPTVLVSRAKQANARFLIVTDHYELIESPYIKFPYIPVPLEKDHGFDNYRDRFSKLASSDFVIITGAEITSHWDDADSHLLALGDLAFADRELIRLQGQKDVQQAVIDRVNELELLSVAAHPSLIAMKYKQWRGQIDNFRFNRLASRGIRGIEFFNDEDIPGYQMTLSWYLSLSQQGNSIFVTSGCDSHFPSDPDDSDCWKRKTWVWSDSLDKESLLQAMSQGRTYAANDGAYFERLNYLPKFEFQEVDQPEFEFTVAFDPTAAIGAEFYPRPMTDITVQFYRNGTLIPDSVHTYQIDLRRREKFDYSWVDNEVKAGEHWYVIEVEGVLITSPIRLKIKPQSLVKDWKEYKIENLYYSVPSDWQVGPEAEGGISRMYYTDRGHTTFMVGAMDAFKEFEPGKWRIAHYGFDGGKVEEPGTTSRTISIGHMGRLVNSFKTEIAGCSVTVCVLRLTKKEGMPVEGEESTNWSFALIKNGKHYGFTLISVDPASQSAIFEQFVSRIHF